jgi:hypothetical protein
VAEALGQSSITNTAGEVSDGLNFDATTTIAERTDAPAGAQVVSVPIASGLSILLGVIALLVSLGIGRSFARRLTPSRSCLELAPAWHLLSLLVSSFLGLNVFFGGLSAFLLNGAQEDAQAYFAEISPLKLARLSHEHFFGYGVSFGIMAALAFFFLGPNKKRVLVPVLASFSFAALDAASWWMARYLSFGFHTLSFLTGGVFALSFLALYMQIVRVNLSGIRSALSSGLKEH